MGNSKKYGTPYSRRELLKRGDITVIANRTGFSYANVSQQIRGERKMHPLVEVAANAVADEMQSKIDSLK